MAYESGAWLFGVFLCFESMIKLIKSYIAYRNWMNAHSFMANISPDLALVAIRRAVKSEPDEIKLPKYLELQGHIESELGKTKLAMQTFYAALKIIEKYKPHFNFGENKDLKDRILSAINEIQIKGT